MTSPGSTPGIYPSVSGGESCQGDSSLEKTFNQRLDSTGDRVGVQATLGGTFGPPQGFASTFQAAYFSDGLSGIGPRNFLSPPKGGSGGNHGAVPWVLRSPFLRTEELRGLPSCPGPVRAKQVFKENSFPNGNGFFDTRGHTSWRLGHFPGPEGCLFSYSHPSSVQEVAQVRLAREGLPVPGPSVRAFPCPLGFYPNYQGDVRGGPCEGDQTLSLPGRLVNPCGQSVSQPPTFSRGGLSGRRARLPSQRQEILPNAVSVFHFSGDGVRHADYDRPPVSGEDRSLRFSARSPSLPARHIRSHSGFATRADGVSGSSGSSRSCPQEGSAAPVPSSVVPDFAVMGHCRPSGRLVQGGDPTMDSECLARGGSPHIPPRCSGRALHRRFPGRVGCACRGPHSLGPVAAGVARRTYQCSGDASCLQGTPLLCSRSAEQDGVVVHRQYHRRLLRKQRGGDALSHSVPRGRVSSPLLPEEGNHTEGQAYCRKGQYPGRLFESPGHDSSDRMDTHPFSPSSSLGAMVQTHDRPVRYSIQQEASYVCFARTGPQGHRDGCASHELGGSVGIRLPSPSHSRKGNPEGQIRSPLPDSDRPPVAGAVMVPGFTRTFLSSSSQTERRKKRPRSAKIRHLSRKPGKALPSRLASVRQNLQALGASRQVIDLVTSAHRSGTNAIYSSHWKRWVNWCKVNSVPPAEPTELQVAEFLGFLRGQKLSTSTLRCYRAAICTTLRQIGSEFFPDSPLLKDVIRGSSLKEARTPRRLPAWDLFLVLASLREKPFEPLYSADLASLTQKTVFLIALASGRRASEICSLSGRDQDIAMEQDGSYTLSFLPEFLAKNQAPSDPSPSIRIRSLKDFLCPDDPDLKLCPVRSLKRYLRFTRSLRINQRQLFISVNPQYSKDISKTSISRWLRDVIKRAYASSNLETNSSRAHEIRAWASSTAFAQSWSLKEVLAAAYWRSESPFINFYLRDVSLRREDGTRGVSSFVAAQQVVQSRHL